nr:hypothetical protein [Tanacetum cinerariifolium]
MKFLIRMPPRRTRNINDVYEHITERIEERLDQFVDQFANQMNDIINPRRRGDRNGQRNEGEESKNLFFEGNGLSLFAELEEWEVDGVVDNNLNFQEDENNVSFSGVVLGVEEELMLVYDPNIEDVIEKEEGFVRKGGFGGKKTASKSL